MQGCTPWVRQDKQTWQGPPTAQEPVLEKQVPGSLEVAVPDGTGTAQVLLPPLVFKMP